MALSSVSRERSEPRKRSLEVCAPMQARGAAAPRPQIEVIYCCFAARDAVVYERLMPKLNLCILNSTHGVKSVMGGINEIET